MYLTLNRHSVAGDAALHIPRSEAIEFAVLDRSRPRIVAPALPIADGNDVGVAVEQQRFASASPFPGCHNIRAPLVATVDRNVTGMFLKGLPVGFPHIDLKTHLGQIAGEEFLDGAFVAGDARN